VRAQSYFLNLRGRTHPLALARLIDELEEDRMAKITQPPTIVTPPGGHPAPIAKPGPLPPRPK
jgi:hypothetical protein